MIRKVSQRNDGRQSNEKHDNWCDNCPMFREVSSQSKESLSVLAKKTEFETFDMQFCGFLNLAYLATFVTFESHRFTGVVKHTE